MYFISLSVQRACVVAARALFACGFAVALLLSAEPAGAQDGFVPAGTVYPLVEEFDRPDDFDVTNPEKISIADGVVRARPQGEGEQYVHRPIPSFSGNVRLTVEGQINEWENNCFVQIGIGDELQSGVMVSKGFFGGGCPVQGPLIDARGARLEHGTDGCTWLGPWLWVDEARPYEATLTVIDGEVDLSVASVGSVTGTLTYDGVYSMLFVGETGRNVSSNYCSVDIERVRIEPLPGALIASRDLTAEVAYPTRIDLRWTHTVPEATTIHVERAEEGRAWREVGRIEADATEYVDSGVTCGMTYLYRTNILTADGRQTGYSNVARAETPSCVTMLHEDWSDGLRSERWIAYGSPAPQVEHRKGPDGSRAFEPNGDGIFHSGIVFTQPIDVTSGLKIDYRMRGSGVIGEKHSSLSVGLGDCGPTDNLEETCDHRLIRISGSTVSGKVQYVVDVDEPDLATEEWIPLDGVWHDYRIQVKPDGMVDFFRNGELVHASTMPIDLARSGLLHLHIHGKSQAGEWHIDDLRVGVPAPPDWYVKVVDERGHPLSDAEVFADGVLLGRTSPAGIVYSDPLPPGTALAARKLVARAPAVREMHDGWSYATFLTNLSADDEAWDAHIVTETGEQRLVLRRTQPLILFNLLVSVEWDATEAYLHELERAFVRASDHLLDLTDGQMAFGNVAIYANGAHWPEADVQVSTKNIVRPHAYVGGLLERDTARIIRIGRGWDGASGNAGPWDAPEGYRTLAHEFAHYALHLYDEYVAYEFDDAGNVIGERPAHCTVSHKETEIPEAIRASAMYDGYRATEFSALNVPGLWSSACEETLHFQFTGESVWETIVARFADPLADLAAEPPVTPRWQMISPIDRGAVLAGPTHLPPSLPAWPIVQIYVGENPEPPRTLTVVDPTGQPAANAIVALYRQSGDRVIGQGLTDDAGTLAVFGADIGDRIQAASFDAGLAGKVDVDESSTLRIDLEPVSVLERRPVAYDAARAIPHMRIFAEPSAEAGQIDLRLTLHNFGEDTDLGISLSEPGGDRAFAPVLGYSPTTGVYSGQISFAATEQGLGRVRVFGSMADTRVRLHAAYRLQPVFNQRYSEVFSDDGNLHLQIDAGSLPSSEAYFVVMPPGAIPGPLPAGMTLVGDPYDVTASGALTVLEKPALLAMHYDQHLLSERAAERLGLYRWDPVAATWQELRAEFEPDRAAMIATVRALGVFALLMPDTVSGTQRSGAGVPACDDCLSWALEP